MAGRFQYRLSSLFWLVAIVAVNCVAFPPLCNVIARWFEPSVPADAFAWCSQVIILEESTQFPEEHPWYWPGPPERPDPPIPNWQPTELTYLNDDDSVTVELIGND